MTLWSYDLLVTSLPHTAAFDHYGAQKGIKMINVSNLNFTYTGTQDPAIKNMSFAIEPGEIFGFLGPSGAGKSTTQKILFRLL